MRSMAKPLLCCLALTLTGCALGRSEIDVAARPPQADAPTRQTVAITEIRDLRPFHSDPGRPEIPSLSTEAALQDKSVTDRAIGRTRNAYNMKMGDVVLPANQTVTGLVRQAVTTALREKGYAVVEQPAAGVVPIAVDIEQFWAWFEPGLLTVRLEFDSHLLIHGRGLIERTPMFVQGRASAAGTAATTSSWQQVVQQGLDNLVANIKDEIDQAVAVPNVVTVPSP